MENLREHLLEKSIQFWIRAALRIMAWVVLLFYMIWRIIMPVVAKEPVFLDKNDGYIMLGCIAILLAIEAVRGYVRRKLESEK